MSGKPNPPAFPNEGGPGNLWNDKGMSLRDYFAAKAMQTLANEEHSDAIIQAIAMTAYDYADAMLAAREAK